MKFVACDMPEATPFMLHIYAAVAQEEARAVSARTKAALAAAKQRGVRLGVTGAERAIRYKAEAKARAIELAPILRDLKQQGLSLRGIAAALTAPGIDAPRRNVASSASRPRPRASSRRPKLATTRRGVRAWLPLSAFNPMPPFSDRRGSR